MHVLAFEDGRVDRLGVLTAARPACDLMIGASSLHDALAHIGHVERVVRPHLARHIAGLAGRRITLWGGATPPVATDVPASRHGATALVVNARVVPSRRNIQQLRNLVEAGHRGAVRTGDTIAAAVLHLAADGGSDDRAAWDALRDTGSAAALEALALEELDADLDLLHEPYDVISAHEQSIEGSLAMRIDSGRFRETKPGLFVADGASVAEQVVVRHGPVVVEAGAEIGPFVCVDGPAFVGPGARVNPHAWIRAATALGMACRAGGEIEATIMEPFSNKPHDGFLGHSHVGSWVNIAAGTITSNLKATYGPIRLHTMLPDGSRETIHTGRQFLGAMIGDFAKTAINASIPCGARIGVAATVGGAVPEMVTAFTNSLANGRSTAEQAATILERMMGRRGLEIMPADRELLEALAR
ncbi:MAG: putative sugar nucleotidyl transferase [Planctomycetia bacterium]|jgi:UDP-N-acetylglucosamine diphosphorylase/glucosamine-1-phosphate N-acetyltransferase